MKRFLVLFLSMILAATAFAQTAPTEAPMAIDLAPSIAKLEQELVAAHGEAIRLRLHRGLTQAAAFWRASDGDAAAFESFVRANFATDEKTRNAMFDRLQVAFEQLGGLMLEAVRELRMHADVDRGPILPFDQILAGYDPSAHLNDDLFENKIAFVVLLNFPLTTLDERVADGDEWSRRQWAEARLAQQFSRRVPADVNLAIANASSASDAYIADYNIWMHHLVDAKGARLFPAELRLITHWNLRDELKANYSEKNGLAKQKAIQQVMERIVTQTIPEIVVDNPRVDWNPFTNQVSKSTVVDYEESAVDPLPATVTNAPEPNTRYARLLDVYRANRLADPYSPTAPTLIARRFNEDRELPEARVRAMLEKVVGSPLVPRVAKLIEKRLGRKLEPFDIWYNGFKPRGTYTEQQLDEITRKKYPTPEAFAKDIPNILAKLEFEPETISFVSSMIDVHPSRGAGHAFGAGRRGDKAYLRTRVGANGMDYKGYNIAVHELGHNVEQTLSMNRIDYTLLQGVPNTAFTEALAFVFQDRDLELLGLSEPDETTRALGALDDFWGAYEIGGVALVDMGVWHWMYEHPEATPEQLRDATLAISRDVWNRYYAPVFGKKDVVLLGVYSHMIASTLYLPDYPLGHMIAFQIKEQIEKTGKVGPEFARMAVIGDVLPDLWMQKATGAPVGPEALLAAAEKALAVIR
ncbi:MAG TPA: hypothetical protein VFV54_10250 [Thermoanaerobaculia bacterium]|nr:hypothetical protein [Thermoanaerobaculia bacterium]